MIANPQNEIAKIEIIIMTHIKAIETIIPSKKDVSLAAQSSQILATHVESAQNLNIQILIEGETLESVTLPAKALRLLVDILAQMAEGNAVSVIPVSAELTTQEAADLLSVSRPYMVRLIEDGDIFHRKIGSHRRILAKDVMTYKTKIDAARLKTLVELSEQAQKLKMGYE
jgi:excisionase family DNA binding protein